MLLKHLLKNVVWSNNKKSVAKRGTMAPLRERRLLDSFQEKLINFFCPGRAHRPQYLIIFLFMFLLYNYRSSIYKCRDVHVDIHISSYLERERGRDRYIQVQVQIHVFISINPSLYEDNYTYTYIYIYIYVYI